MDRRTILLDKAKTLNADDAISKVRDGFKGIVCYRDPYTGAETEHEISFEEYYSRVAHILYQLRNSPNHRYIPSEEQLRFIMSTKPCICVIAGPGSGKSTTLLNRLIIHQAIFNTKGSEILGISYTKASAKDMSIKYSSLANSFRLPDDINFKTIHKFGSDLISLLNPNITIITETNGVIEYIDNPHDNEPTKVEHKLYDLVELALKICKVDVHTVNAKMFYSAVNIIAEKMIESDTEFRESSEDYLDFPLTFEEIREIRMVYQQLKQKYSCIDFTDMLELVYQLLSKENTEVLKRNPNINKYLSFKSIYIDESQDISPLQKSIVLRLLDFNKENNCTLCVVGDEDQSIFGFRGADPSFLLDFLDLFPPIVTNTELNIIDFDEDGEPIYEESEVTEDPTERVDIIYMTKNRRSGRDIINVANQIIKHNTYRYDKLMQPMRDFDGEVKLVPNVKGLAHGMILGAIKELAKDGRGIYSSIGILYREHKQILPLLNKLVQERVPINSPYPVTSSYYVHNMRPTQDIIGIIQFLFDMQNPALVRQFLYKVLPSVSEQNASVIATALHNEQHKPMKERKKLSNLLKEGGYTGLDKLKQLYTLVHSNAKMMEIFSFVLKEYKTAYFDNYLKTHPKDSTLLNLTTDYFVSHGEATWAVFMQRHSNLISWIEQNSQVSNGVHLSPFHSAKGLEFDKVFILEVSDENSPKASILKKYTDAGRLKYIEEERRTYFVAITRAIKEATIFFSPENPDSLFIKETRDALDNLNEQKRIATLRSQAQPVPQSQPQPVPQPQLAPQPVPQSQPQPVPQPQPQLQITPQSQPAPQLAPQSQPFRPQPIPASTSAPIPQPQPQSKSFKMPIPWGIQ